MNKDCKFYEGARGIFNAAVATGTGKPIFIADFKNILLTLSSSGNAAFTIKFQGSGAATVPDFSSAVSATNKWEYIQVKDRQNDAGINGDTGVAFTDDDVRIFELNTNVMNWVCATITARTQGTIYLDVMATNNV